MDVALIIDNEEEVIWKKVTRSVLSYCFAISFRILIQTLECLISLCFRVVLSYVAVGGFISGFIMIIEWNFDTDVKRKSGRGVHC